MNSIHIPMLTLTLTLTYHNADQKREKLFSFQKQP